MKCNWIVKSCVSCFFIVHKTKTKQHNKGSVELSFFLHCNHNNMTLAGSKNGNTQRKTGSVWISLTTAQDTRHDERTPRHEYTST